MTLVKICGMRGVDDLEACRRADLLGFVIMSDSPRCLDLRKAAELMSSCENTRVAVTTETRPALLRAAVRALEPDVLQVHSPLDARLLRPLQGLGVKIWGMHPVGTGMGMDREALSLLDALLLDTPGPRGGGGGRVHDWKESRRLVSSVGKPVVLAGGLRPDNVAEAIRTVRPHAVDVSSGVEGIGGKDPVKVKEFIDLARGALE